ncbi:hypothetical protein RI367_004799 [Sorochytrium milnesiophthora]
MDTSTALSHLPLSEELLKYYRDRIQAFENDLQTFVAQVDALKPVHAETHTLSWQLHQRNLDVRQLQATISDLQTQVLDERKLVVRAMAENDELRVQELKDRRKIRWLLALTAGNNVHATDDTAALQQPQAGDVTYFRDTLHKRFVKARSEIRLKATATTTTTAPTASTQRQRRTSQEPSRSRSPSRPPAVTVDEDPLMGSEPGLTLKDEVEVLRTTVEALRTQLAEQQAFHEDALMRLSDSREQQLRRFEYQQAQDAKRIEELVIRVGKLQGFMRDNTKELLRLRRSHLMSERLFKEERASMMQQTQSLREQYGELRNKSESVEKAVETRVVKKNEALVHELRTQLARYEDELRTFKTKQEDAEAGYKKRITALQSKITNMNRDYKNLKKRRDFEIEGFTTDILSLRKQVQSLEKIIIKFGQVDDRELELLDSAAGVGRKASKIQDQVTVLKRKMYQAEEELRGMAI